MARHLVLRLASPLIAFGGEVIDNRGVIRDFPGLSMLTGLIASALGWDRSEDARHNRLQQRLRMGTALEPGAHRLQDFQTAELGAADRAFMDPLLSVLKVAASSPDLDVVIVGAE